VKAGRLNGVDAPVGTLLGPDTAGRPLVVDGREAGGGVTVSYATAIDIQSAMRSIAVDGPRSVAEGRMISDARRAAVTSGAVVPLAGRAW
jgi:hypothetical protein